ncbi:hypothetical protein ACR3K2_35180 [Cryptosporidium serpentis]
MESRYDLSRCTTYPNNSLINGFVPIDLGTNQESLPQKVQEKGFVKQQEMKLQMNSIVYGYHSSLRARMEQDIVSKTQRHPGLPSSHLSLDLVMGCDDSLDICDYLNIESPLDPLGKMSINSALEARFGI